MVKEKIGKTSKRLKILWKWLQKTRPCYNCFLYLLQKVLEFGYVLVISLSCLILSPYLVPLSCLICLWLSPYQYKLLAASVLILSPFEYKDLKGFYNHRFPGLVVGSVRTIYRYIFCAKFSGYLSNFIIAFSTLAFGQDWTSNHYIFQALSLYLAMVISTKCFIALTHRTFSYAVYRRLSVSYFHFPLFNISHFLQLSQCVVSLKTCL